MPWIIPETFTAGQTLTAASMNIVSADLRMGGPVFTTEAARDAAITAPEEGQTAYLTAPTVPAATGAGTAAVPTGVLTIYNGSAWVCVTPVGGSSTTAGTTTATAAGTSTLTGDATAISVTVATGTTALVMFSVNASHSTGNQGVCGVQVSGATTLAASVNNGASAALNTGYQVTFGRTFIITGLTAGTNTFTLNYWTAAGTLTMNSRYLNVQGIA